MAIKVDKVTNIVVKTTDGVELNIGDTVIFLVEGKCYAGIYTGVTKKGAISFSAEIGKETVTFNFMPNSIDALYCAEVRCLENGLFEEGI